MKKIKYRLVYNRRKLLNAQGAALIQVEASLGKYKTYFSTGIYIRPEEWESKTSSIVKHPHAHDLNTWVYEFVMRLESLELSMWKRGVKPTLSQIKLAFESNRTASLTFQSFCVSIINSKKRKDSTKQNLLGTLSTLNKVRSTYTWDDLDYGFLRDFEGWLYTKNYAINTIAKHLRNLRTFINEAVASGYLSVDANPFKQYTIKQEKTTHRYLSPDELEAIEQIKLHGVLEHIRDAFLFCCYTGLRFSDFTVLNNDNFIESKGEIWLMAETQKTGYKVQIPLYLIFEGKALGILKRYASISHLTKIGSNAQVNRKLAELQQLLLIKKRITFHTARHTCATMLCHQGVPITTVQKILGHMNLSTTQIYSEVMADTIVKDLTKVMNKEKKAKN